MSFEFDGTLLEADRNLVDAQKMGDMGLEVGSFVVSIAAQGNAIIQNDFLYLYELAGAGSAIYGRASVKTPSITLVDGMLMYGKGSASMNTTTGRYFPIVGITGVTFPSLDINTDINTFYLRIYNTTNAANTMNVSAVSNNISYIIEQNNGNLWTKELIAVIDKTNNQVFAYYRPDQTTGDYYLGAIFDVALLDNPFFTCSPYQNETVEDYGIFQSGKIPDKLYPELITPDFQQTFSNADGSPDFGGTGEDPATKTACQISGGIMQGVASPPARFGTIGTLSQTLTDANTEGICATVEMANIQNDGGQRCDFIIKDSSLTSIVVLRFFYDGIDTFIQVVNKSETIVATLSAGPLSTALLKFFFYVDIVNKVASVFSTDVTLTNNTNIDISDGGGMVSTEIKAANCYITAGIGLASTLGMQYDNLKIYPLTRSITP